MKRLTATIGFKLSKPILSIFATILSSSAPAVIVDAPFSAASDVPITADFFSPDGDSLALSLHFDPDPGTVLTVVETTGDSPISGEFSNLSHGQRVVITHGAKRFSFIANYRGGDGNDLVLIWARQTAVWMGRFKQSPSDFSPGGLESNGDQLRAYPIINGLLKNHTPVEFRSTFHTAMVRLADDRWVTWQVSVDTAPVEFEMEGAFAGKTIASLAAGDYHFLALCTDGSLISWGMNGAGQLGNGEQWGETFDPIDITGRGALAGKTVVAVAAGRDFSLALCSDGTMAAWGGNSYGQLGTSGIPQENDPTSVIMSGALSGKTVSRIYCTDTVSAALTTEGKVYTWGHRHDGILGNGGTLTGSFKVWHPVAVDDSGVLAGKVVTDLSLGPDHVLARCSDQTLASWGSNFRGTLGDGTQISSAVPVAVAGLDVLGDESIKSISAVDKLNFLLTEEGTIYGWGSLDNFEHLPPEARITPAPLSLTGEYQHGRIVQVPGYRATTIIAQAVSSDSSLAGLAFDSATLQQGILPARFHYVAALRPGATEVRLTPFPSDPDALISINGEVVTSGESGSRIPLAPEGGEISIVIAAGDGSTSEYLIEVIPSPDLDVVLMPDAEPAITAAAYDATGGTARVSLGFPPSSGSVITLIENTGLNPIGGSFDNLKQDQIVELPYAGIRYRFAVNYFGGSGNDLVIEWATRKLVVWGSDPTLEGPDKVSLFPIDLDPAGALVGRSVRSVVTGGLHTLALCTDGTVVAWGQNDGGQLGNGGFEASAIPVEVDRSGPLEGRRVVAIAAGTSHSLALCSDGVLVGWGDNEKYQLGDETGGNRPRPVICSIGEGLPFARPVMITAGQLHSAALFSNGKVVTWGANNYYQLGARYAHVTNTIDLGDPELEIEFVISGLDQTYVRCTDQSIWSWGSNSWGQVDETRLEVPAPVRMESLEAAASGSVVHLAAGMEFGLALDSSGKIFGWGNNQSDQLAPKEFFDSSHYWLPVSECSVSPSTEGERIKRLIAKGRTSAAITSSGRPLMWGSGHGGVFGNGSTSGDSAVAIEPDLNGVLRDAPVMDMALGRQVVALAAVSPGTILRQLEISAGVQDHPFDRDRLHYRLNLPSAEPTFNITATPEYPYAEVRINGEEAGPSGVNLPVSAERSMVEIEVSLEDGTSTTYSIELLTDLRHTFNSPDDVAVSFANYQAAGWNADLALGFDPIPGTRLTVIDNPGRNLPQDEFRNLAQWQKLTLVHDGREYEFVVNYRGGDGNDLVLEWANRDLAMWGSDAFEALANGESGDSAYPSAPTGPGELKDRIILAVAGGRGHSVALCNEGDIVVWGTATADATPALLSGTGALIGREAVAISAGGGNGLALCSDGTIVAWGDNSYGQLGNGSSQPSDVPVEVDQSGVLAGRKVIALACGGAHCLALDSEGLIYSWGRNDNRQLGIGSSGIKSTPQAVNTGSSSDLKARQVHAIAAGSEHSLALCDDGTLVGWGNDNDGQLAGRGSGSPRSIPARGALTGKTIASLSQGTGNYSLVLCTDGSVIGWGANDLGQLGSSGGSTTVPVAVDTSGVLAGKSIIAISSGFAHSIASCSDGTIVTWGQNTSGELGDGTKSNRSLPVEPDGSGALFERRIVAGAAGMHTLALVAKSSDPYIQYMSGFPGLLDQTDDGDPDNDGLPNLVEFVVQGNPSIGSGDPRPRFLEAEMNAVFSYHRNTASVGGTSQWIEWSENLRDWHQIPIPYESQNDVNVGPVGPNKSQFIQVLLPPTSSQYLFGRHVVTRP